MCFVFAVVIVVDVYLYSAITNFKLNVTTASGSKLQCPLVASTNTLSGREFKVLLKDCAVGTTSRMLYYTAQVFFSGTIDEQEVLFLYESSSQEHEFALAVSGAPSVNSSAITVVSD